jgi:hypothetical protein
VYQRALTGDICLLQLGVYLCTLHHFQEQTNEDDETDVKPFLSVSVDEADMPQEMEECKTEETK